MILLLGAVILTLMMAASPAKAGPLVWPGITPPRAGFYLTDSTPGATTTYKFYLMLAGDWAPGDMLWIDFPFSVAGLTMGSPQYVDDQGTHFLSGTGYTYYTSGWYMDGSLLGISRNDLTVRSGSTVILTLQGIDNPTTAGDYAVTYSSSGNSGSCVIHLPSTAPSLDFSVVGDGSIDCYNPYTFAEVPQGACDPGTLVELFPDAADGWYFDHWTGALSGGGAFDFRKQVMVVEQTGVGAVFKDTVPITVSWNAGGTVSPGSGDFAFESTQYFTATANPGYHFVEWIENGDRHQSDNPHPLYMSLALVKQTPKTLQAVFAPNVVEFEVSKTGEGSGVVTQSLAGTTFTGKTTLTFVAAADPGSRFDHWEYDVPLGDGSGEEYWNFETHQSTDRYLDLNIDTTGLSYPNTEGTLRNGPVSVRAVFIVPDTYYTAVGITGPGAVSASPGLYNLPGAGVTLTAAPVSGYSTFSRWESPDLTIPSEAATNPVLTFEMPAQDIRVRAFFIGQDCSLTATANPPEGGTVSPTGGTYPYGSWLQVTATANPGWHLSGWTGLTNGEWLFGDTAMLGIWGDRTISADFTPNPYSVTYDANGGTGAAPIQPALDQGDSFTTAANTFTAPAGRHFQGWNTAADGSGTAYGVGASVTMPAGDLVLYAAWEANVFFSEYLDGYSKVLEIYNASSVPVDLATADYRVEIYHNGYVVPGTTVDLTGSIAPHGVYVIANSLAQPEILEQADQTMGGTMFNGNDTIVLRRGTEFVDVFGQLGYLSGTGWSSNGIRTWSVHLGRKSSVTQGDAIPSDVFDPSAEWVELGFDDHSTLGSHQGNQAPVAAASTVTAEEDTDYTFSAGDFAFTDADNDSLDQVEVATLPDKGTLTLAGAAVEAGQLVRTADIGNLLYRAAPDENGMDYSAFTFKILAGGAWSASAATATIDVTAVNDPPVAGDDTASTFVNAPIAAVDLLTNDTDPDAGDTLLVRSVTDPPHGTAVLDADGSVTYTPDEGYDGQDGFDYVVSDGYLTDTGTVTIIVIRRDEAPPVVTAPPDVITDATDDSGAAVDFAPATAVDDVDGEIPPARIHYFTRFGTPEQAEVASGDVFPIGTTTVTAAVTDSSGNIGTATFTITVKTPLVELLDQRQEEAHTTYAWPPVAAETPWAQSFSPGYTGPLNKVSLYINSQDLDGFDAQVQICAWPVTGLPAGEEIIAQASVHSSSPSPGDYWQDFTFPVPPTLTAGAQYAIVISGDGFNLWTNIDGYLAGSAYGWRGSYWSDRRLDFKFRTYSLVDPEAPTDVLLDNHTVDENLAAGAPVGSFSTTDPDGDDTFTYELVSGAGASGNASFALSPDGTLTTAAIFDWEGVRGYTIRVRSTDSSGLSVERLFRILVNDVNEHPTDITLSGGHVDENEPADSYVVATFQTTDPDIYSDSFTYSLVEGEGDTDNTFFRFDEFQNLRTTSEFDHEAKDALSIRVRSTDSAGHTVEKAFAIAVNDVNDPPTDITISNSTVDENQPLGTAVGDLGTADQDAGQTFTYALVSGEGDSGNSLFTAEAGTLRTAEVLDREAGATYSIRVRTTDSGTEPLSYERVLTITVNDVNEPPTANRQALSTPEDTPLEIALGGSDPEGASLSYAVQTGPTHGSLGPLTDGRLTYSPSPDFNGEDSFSFTVSDGEFVSELVLIDLGVTPVNDPPAAEAGGPYSGEEGGAISFGASGQDVDGGIVDYAWDWDYDGSFTASGDTGPTASHSWADNGSYTVGVKVTDDEGATTVATTTVEVANVSPTAVLGNDGPVQEGSPATVDFAEVSDPGAGDTFTYAFDFDNDGIYELADQTGSSAEHSWPNNGSYEVRGRITDDDGGFSEYTTEVEVLNAAPVVDAGEDQSVTEGDAVQFTAEARDPGVDDVLSFAWDFGDGSPTADTLEATHVYGAASGGATYTATFTVTDDEGAATSDTVKITVDDVDPVARIDGDGSVYEGRPATFDAGGSSSGPDGIEYEWDFEYDGSFAPVLGETGATATHTWPDQGHHVVAVRVADGDGQPDVATWEISVENAAPEVDGGPEGQQVQYSDAIETITVVAGDVNADTLVLSTEWKARDGVFVEGLPAGLTITTGPVAGDDGDGTSTTRWTIAGRALVPAGFYTLSLTAADEDGGAAAYEVEIEVTPEDAIGDLQSETAYRTAPGADYTEPLQLVVWVSEAHDGVLGGPAGDVPAQIAEVAGIEVAGCTLESVGGGSIKGTATVGAWIGSGSDSYIPVTCTFSGGIPVDTYSLVVRIAGAYYAGTYESVIVVYDPTLGFTTGGGWFFWPGTTDKTNFGYTMKYNKKATNIQGGLVLIRHLPDGSVYRIKSNALYGLALTTDDVPGTASFAGKCTYVGPESYGDDPEQVATFGGMEFMAYVEDGNEPGSLSDQLWFSVPGMDFSLDDGDRKVQAGELVELQGGNIVVPHAEGKNRK